MISKKNFGKQMNIKIICSTIHGYNDYSNSFQVPATFLAKSRISTISFDLRVWNE